MQPPLAENPFLKDENTMANQPSPEYSEVKVDIGKYIETLARQKTWIIGCAVIICLLAVFASQAVNWANPSYQAIAIVSSSKNLSIVNFGGDITSQSETNLAADAASGAQYIYDRKARLQSYVALVRNGAVAEKVLAQLGSKLEPAERTTSALSSLVSGALVPNSDSIRISVLYRDPLIAAEIANVWADAYVQQINNMFGDTNAGTSVAVIENEIDSTKASYDLAQKALSDFESQNKTEEYKRQIEELTTVAKSLRDSLAAVSDQDSQYRIARLKQAYADKLSLERFLVDVNSMRDAVRKGGESAAVSNALALTLLKTQIYAAFDGSTSLQIQNLPESIGAAISTVNASSMATDLDALNATLTSGLTAQNELIATISSSVQNGDNTDYLNDLVSLSASQSPIEQKIAETEQKMRDLNALLSDSVARETELTKARDLAWQSYSALTTKGTEMSVAAQTTGSEVLLGSLATPPTNKVVRSGYNALTAAIVGLIIGLVSAYFYEFWQSYKGRETETISKAIFLYFRNMFVKKPAASSSK